MQSDISARWRLIEVAREMNTSRLSPGRSGNVSARRDDGFLITPTGLPYGGLRPDDIVFIDENGHTARGQRRPSSEWRFHFDIYRRFPEVGGVVHCHARHASALACAGLSIPAFHYMVAVAGGVEIPLAPYATFGTQELSDHILAALGSCRAALMEHHGLVATGTDLAAAYDLAHEVEELAAQYILTLSLGARRVLPVDEMARVIERFKTYGKQDGNDPEPADEE